MSGLSKAQALARTFLFQKSDRQALGANGSVQRRVGRLTRVPFPEAATVKSFSDDSRACFKKAQLRRNTSKECVLLAGFSYFVAFCELHLP